MSREVLLAISLPLGVGLIVVLGYRFDVDWAQLWQIMRDVPREIYVALAGLNGILILAAAEKWRIALQFLSGGETRIGHRQAVTATALGVLFGQVLPIQIVTPIVRMLSARMAGVPARVSFGSSLFEQIFDLVALAAVGVASALAVVWGLSGFAAILVGCVILIGVVLSVPPLMRLGAATGHRLQDRLNAPETSMVSRLTKACETIETMPRGLWIRLLGLSLFRVFCIVVAAVLMVAAVAEAVPWQSVAAAAPLVQLLMALPLTPAGLGFAEWSWAGLFALGGLTGTAAAGAAITLRLINFAGLLIALIVWIPVLIHQRMVQRA